MVDSDIPYSVEQRLVRIEQKIGLPPMGEEPEVEQPEVEELDEDED